MAEDNKRPCLRCGGEMVLHRKGYVEMRAASITFEQTWPYLELHVCPNCRYAEWFMPPTPYEELEAERKAKENMTSVEKFEYNFRDYTDRQLQKVIDGRDYVDDAKKAARNLLYRRKYGE